MVMLAILRVFPNWNDRGLICLQESFKSPSELLSNPFSNLLWNPTFVLLSNPLLNLVVLTPTALCFEDMELAQRSSTRFPHLVIWFLVCARMHCCFEGMFAVPYFDMHLVLQNQSHKALCQQYEKLRETTLLRRTFVPTALHMLGTACGHWGGGVPMEGRLFFQLLLFLFFFFLF